MDWGVYCLFVSTKPRRQGENYPDTRLVSDTRHKKTFNV